MRVHDLGGVGFETDPDCETEVIAEQMSISEALAINMQLRSLGYPSKAQQRLQTVATEVISRHAKDAISRIEGGLCATCWGDGWHQPWPGMLQGACHTCNGTGRRPPTVKGES